MMTTLVKGKDGHEAKVVDHDDLLAAERYLRNWILGVMGGLLTTIVASVIYVVTLRGHLDGIENQVKTLQVQGSEAVRQLQIDVAVIRSKQDATSAAIEQNRVTLLEIMNLLTKRTPKWIP